MKLLGPAKGFRKLIQGISVEDVQRSAALGFTILVTGPSLVDCLALVSHLAGTTGQFAGPNRTFRPVAWPVTPDRLDALKGVDLIVFVAGWHDEIPFSDLEILRSSTRGLTPLVTVIHGHRLDESTGQKGNGPSGTFEKTVVLERLAPTPVVDQVVPAIVDLLPEHAVALGRAFPPFKQAASAKVINDASWTNAKFAAISNVSAVVPIVGNLMAATADLIVLTRNQIVLLLKLAAIHGRDIHDQRSIYKEILPVVGAAFIWRTVARETAALIPGLLGAVPKIVIAYAGTYAVGQAATYYYDKGRKPPTQMIRSFYARAAEQASLRLTSLLPKGSHRPTHLEKE
ncbi:MAG: hypothetical protein Q7O66_13680 [Dehalococcoidia bacterium]|nr:hypothetical protein [Dehalococcoidia bacterium]